MKETLVEVMAAGAYLLSPHAVEQPAIAEPASAIEIVADSKCLESVHLAQPETPKTVLIESDIVKAAVSTLHIKPDQALPHSDNTHNVAILEVDPSTLEFWAEVGGLGLSGIGTLLFNRRLKRSLRRNHTTIKDEGWEAQTKLNAVLEAARERVTTLWEDDVLTLRKLIEEHDATSVQLFNALAHTDAEFDAERGRFFARKGRLRRAPHTKLIVDTTKTAAKQAAALQHELDKVRTDFAEIGVNIDRAKSSVLGLRGNLDALIERGWDVGTYEQRVAELTDSVATAQTERDEKYIEKPTEIAKAVTAEALELQKEAGALEPRRTAADEVYGTQPGRITAAKETVEAIRERLAALHDTYNTACLAGYEALPDELTEALAELKSTYKDGGALTGEQGKSVDAVEYSEELSASFDETIEEIQSMAADLRRREERLATLVKELPRKVRELRIQFDQAVDLAKSSDVEDDAKVKIESLAADVFNLSASIRTKKGRKPDYLDVEARHSSLAQEVAKAHKTASQQKQEMNDLRTNIPPLKDEYNNLVKVIWRLAKQPDAKIKSKTLADVATLLLYEYKLAPDRKNLREQKEQLEGLLENARSLMNQVKKKL